jgi:hypothetical protein
MLTSTAVSQLESLISKTRLLAESIRCIRPCPNTEHYQTFEPLKVQFQDAVGQVKDAIELLESETAERVRKESEKFLDQAQSATTHIIENGQPKSISPFRKCLTMVFEGPKDSALDAGPVKARNKQTRQRCELIRGLNCDGIISWAAALPQSNWAAGNMHNHIFTHLLESIEPQEKVAWPSRMIEILRIFGQEEPLSRCGEYQEFLTSQSAELRDYNANEL